MKKNLVFVFSLLFSSYHFLGASTYTINLAQEGKCISDFARAHKAELYALAAEGGLSIFLGLIGMRNHIKNENFKKNLEANKDVLNQICKNNIDLLNLPELKTPIKVGLTATLFHAATLACRYAYFRAQWYAAIPN